MVCDRLGHLRLVHSVSSRCNESNKTKILVITKVMEPPLPIEIKIMLNEY